MNQALARRPDRTGPASFEARATFEGREDAASSGLRELLRMTRAEIGPTRIKQAYLHHRHPEVAALFARPSKDGGQGADLERASIRRLRRGRLFEAGGV